jgi:hypothetical protein
MIGPSSVEKQRGKDGSKSAQTACETRPNATRNNETIQ